MTTPTTTGEALAWFGALTPADFSNWNYVQTMLEYAAASTLVGQSSNWLYVQESDPSPNGLVWIQPSTGNLKTRTIETSPWVLVGSLKGPTGATGATGETGETGPANGGPQNLIANSSFSGTVLVGTGRYSEVGSSAGVLTYPHCRGILLSLTSGCTVTNSYLVASNITPNAQASPLATSLLLAQGLIGTTVYTQREYRIMEITNNSGSTQAITGTIMTNAYYGMPLEYSYWVRAGSLSVGVFTDTIPGGTYRVHNLANYTPSPGVWEHRAEVANPSANGHSTRSVLYMPGCPDGATMLVALPVTVTQTRTVTVPTLLTDPCRGVVISQMGAPL